MKQSILNAREARRSPFILIGTVIVCTAVGGVARGVSDFTSIAPRPTPQESQQTDVRELKLGAPIERDLAGGASHVYGVTMIAGQYLHAVVEQKGIDVVVSLFGPGHQKLTDVDSPNGPKGPEPVSVIAEGAGEYRLEVKSLREKVPPGRYEIRIDELRVATEKDRYLIDAERVLAEAERQRNQGTAQSLGKSLEKYNQALLLLHITRDRWGEAPALRAMEALSLVGLGLIHEALGESQKALEYFQQALPLERAIGDRAGESATLSSIGATYTFLGELRKGLEYYDRSLVLGWVSRTPSDQARTLANMGAANFRLGEQQKAREFLSQALLLARTAGGQRQEAQIQTSLGGMLTIAGESEEALKILNQALALGQSVGDQRGEGWTLINIALAETSLGDSQKALDYFRQALSLQRALGARRDEATTLSLIGGTYLSIDKPEEALSYLAQALSLQRALGTRRDEAITLSLMGGTYSSLGKPEEALNYLGQALSLQRATGDRWSEISTLRSAAQAERDLGHLGIARIQIEAALDIAEKTRSTFVRQDLRTSFLASYQPYYQFYVDLLMRMHQGQPTSGYNAAALQASERSRARSLSENLAEARVDIREGVDPLLLKRERLLEEELNAKAEFLTRLLNGKHNPEQETAVRKEVDARLADYQEVEAEIRTKSPRYAALTQPEPLSVKEIQQMLDEDTLLLEYALGQERSYLWAVTPTSIKSFELPKQADIEAEARRIRDLLVTKADAVHPEALMALSRTLLGPVADQLGRKRLLIVSQGGLQYIPLGALPEPLLIPQTSTPARNGTLHNYQPLILKHEIISLPSASVLSVLRRELVTRAVPLKRVAVLADPVFTNDDQRVKSRLKDLEEEKSDERVTGLGFLRSDIERSASELGVTRFERPPVSRREAELITDRVAKGQSLKALNFNASRTMAMSPALGEYQIIHFATHSLLNNQHPELSGIVLSLVDESGRPQDGFLRLHDIYNLKLNASLVVLSACETALGKDIKGEGLVGLTRGFMYAGAPRLVASLWKVSDAATAELMNRFYKNMFNEGMRPPAALRAAQVSILKERQWAAPYYWAGFVFQGEWK